MPGIDLKIMAIPCDGIIECRDGSDELYCQEDKKILVIGISGLFLITIFIYMYLIYVKLPKWQKSMLRDFQDKSVNHDWKPTGNATLRGNALASLKVLFLRFIFIVGFL